MNAITASAVFVLALSMTLVSSEPLFFEKFVATEGEVNSTACNDYFQYTYSRGMSAFEGGMTIAVFIEDDNAIAAVWTCVFEERSEEYFEAFIYGAGIGTAIKKLLTES